MPVAELERKHKLLKTRLKVPGVQSMRHRLGQKVTKCGVQDDVRPAQQALQKLHTNIGKQQKRQRVTAINHAYRLAGRSTFSVGEEGLLGVCLETATAGKDFASCGAFVTFFCPRKILRALLCHPAPRTTKVRQYLESETSLLHQYSIITQLSNHLNTSNSVCHVLCAARRKNFLQ